MYNSSPFGYSLGADTAPVPDLLAETVELVPLPSDSTDGVPVAAFSAALPPALPVFPSPFREWSAPTAASGPGSDAGLDDELGPTSAVSALVSNVPSAAPPLPPLTMPRQASAPVTPATAIKESVAGPSVFPEVSAAPAASSAAARQEVAALQEVLYDVALAVSRRKGELAELEEHLAKARSLTDETARLEAQVAAHQAELESAGQHKVGLQNEIGRVQAELDRLTFRSEALEQTLADLEAGVERLQTTSSELEGTISARTTELGELELRKRQELEAGAEQTARMEALHQELAALTEKKDLAEAALTRVKNALCDIQLQVESLTRQAEQEHTQIVDLSARRTTLLAEQQEVTAAVEQQSKLLLELQERAENLRAEHAEIEAESLAKEKEAGLRCEELERSAAAASAKLEDAWRDLSLTKAKHDELRRESAEAIESLESLKAEQRPLQAEILTLKGTCEAKASELTRLDRELLQTRQDIHDLKLKADGREAEIQARRAELEAGLEVIEASHAKAQQAMASTQTRYEALLVKQDEALQALEHLQSRISGLTLDGPSLSVTSPALPPALPIPVRSLAPAAPTSTIEQIDAKLAALRRTEADLEAAIAEKSARHREMERELLKVTEQLAGLQAAASEDEQRFAAQRRQMEEEITTTARTLQESRHAMLNDPWQQDLSNRHSAALNELEATQSNVASLKAEAFELQKIIEQRTTQKEALLDEILRARKTPAAASAVEADEANPAGKTLTDSSWERVVTHLMRLVDATDTAHSHLLKIPTPEAANTQFTLLREVVTSTLGHLGVQEFILRAGTPVDSILRRQIQVVKHLNGEAKPWIERMLSPGFVTDGPQGQKTILRKPEVIVSSEPQPL